MTYITCQRFLKIIIPCLLVASLSSSVNANIVSLEQLTKQRLLFRQTLKQINAGTPLGQTANATSLKSYSLYPYLEYRSLVKNIDQQSDASIIEFLNANKETHYHKRLLKTWLTSVAKKQQWDTFLTYYQADLGDTLYCHYFNAILSTNSEKNIYPELTTFWLTGSQRPPSCNPAFNKLYSSSSMNNELIWQRLALAMAKGNNGLARAMEKRLPQSQRGWVETWTKVRANPAKELPALLKYKDSIKVRDVFVDGIRQYSRPNLTHAHQLWHENIKKRYQFSDKQIAHAEQLLALRAGWRHRTEAQEWLGALPEAAINDEVMEWRVRSALRAQDWEDALVQVEALTDAHKTRYQWRYWRARALEETGDRDTALQIFNILAAKTDYYGFLAAEKLKTDYQFNDISIITHNEKALISEVLQNPNIRRAEEFYKLGMETSARREWYYALGTFDNTRKRVAATIASEWGWHFGAIITAGRAKHYTDISLRFPVKYQTAVKKYAAEHKLSPSYAYGIIRRESAFNPNAVSGAGARGLMQLMPATANGTAKKLNLGKVSRAKILETDTNIQLGTRYLREVLDIYSNHEVLATASYNAGPHRVKAWLPDSGTLPADIWIDTITFDETRKYVRAVMEYSTLYDWKLNKQKSVDRLLKDRLKPVKSNS